MRRFGEPPRNRESGIGNRGSPNAFHYCLCIYYIRFFFAILFNLEELVYHTLLNEQRKLHNILLHFLFCEIKNEILEPKIALKLFL